MTRACSTEEPCAAKVACTVLETSGGSDLLAEFNVRSVDQKPRLTNSEDWSVGERRELLIAYELASGVGAIPTTPGEGLIHIPRGSDWPSIREAGVNAEQLGASPGDAASTDGYGYAQEGNETVVRLNQRKRLRRWSQKAPDLGPAVFGTPGIHPTQVSAEFSHPTSIAKPGAGTE